MANIEHKPTYNLGVVVQETGVKPDTLRAWERRYGLPDPERSEGGHRLYSQHDIDTVKWLVERQEEGMRIGRAADLWKEIIKAGDQPLVEYPLKEAGRPVYSQVEPGSGQRDQAMFQLVREAWLEAALAFEEERAQQILTEAFARYSLEDVWEEVLVKGLEEIGEDWFRGEITVQQEHFATTLVLRRVQTLIDAAPPPIRKEVITVACPPGEHHTLAPLLITLFLRRRGYPVIYLGEDVPLLDLDSSLQATGSELIILTAQVLETASSLVRIAEALVADGYLVGYGGRVYNLFPELIERTPGTFLGEKLTDVPDVVGTLLTKKVTQESKSIDPQHARLLERFQEVELKLWDAMRGKTPLFGLGKEEVILANQQLGKAIRASLVLNDIHYLNAELAWLQGLLVNRNLPVDQLAEYLREAARVLDDLIGPENLISKAVLQSREQMIENADPGE